MVDVTPEALQRMPMLISFVFEVLRVHPIAPALEQHLLSDIEFGGHHLPAGTHVIIATTVTHGLPDLFADPSRFDPTRVSAERAEHRTPGAYVPFGVGARTCAGRGMAEGLLTLDTALLLIDCGSPATRRTSSDKCSPHAESGQPAEDQRRRTPQDAQS